MLFPQISFLLFLLWPISNKSPQWTKKGLSKISTFFNVSLFFALLFSLLIVNTIKQLTVNNHNELWIQWIHLLFWHFRDATEWFCIVIVMAAQRYTNDDIFVTIYIYIYIYITNAIITYIFYKAALCCLFKSNIISYHPFRYNIRFYIVI